MLAAPFTADNNNKVYTTSRVKISAVDRAAVSGFDQNAPKKDQEIAVSALFWALKSSRSSCGKFGRRRAD
jgi:hypothetical protein